IARRELRVGIVVESGPQQAQIEPVLGVLPAVVAFAGRQPELAVACALQSFELSQRAARGDRDDRLGAGRRGGAELLAALQPVAEFERGSRLQLLPDRPAA